MKKEELKQLLRQGCRGQGNAISGRELHKHLQISENEMRRQINLLRQKGVPIGSDQTGYFWAVDASEVVATIHGLKATPHNSSRTSWQHLFRHMSPKSSGIHQGFPAAFVPSDDLCPEWGKNLTAQSAHQNHSAFT